MARPSLLTAEDVSLHMSKRPYWRLSDPSERLQSIVREVQGPDFQSVLAVLNQVAEIAETMDHHPDMLLYGWNKLRITLSTHDKGGLTELDFQLAEKIDALPGTNPNA